MSNPYFFVFLTAVLGAISALWASYKQDESDTKVQKELSDKNDKIISLQQDISNTAKIQSEEQRQLRLKSEEIAELYKKIAAHQTELAQRANRISELSERNARLITGEGNYCTIFSNIIGENVYLSAINLSDSPLYDLKINVEETTQRHENINGPGTWIQISPDELIEEEKKKEWIIVPVLPQNGSKILGKYPITNKIITYYDIDFFGRGGYWRQQLALIRVEFGNHKFRVAYRITKDKFDDGLNKYEILKESIDPHIALDTRKNIKWYSTESTAGPHPELPPK